MLLLRSTSGLNWECIIATIINTEPFSSSGLKGFFHLIHDRNPYDNTNSTYSPHLSLPPPGRKYPVVADQEPQHRQGQDMG